ncbi:MAG: hypothetical protein ACRC28_10185 [Clostridium sp.]|uniref:hypothetical protein n=1 Tax=Clostridium sp. TaxID=1506 RepID=UPI003F36EB68
MASIRKRNLLGIVLLLAFIMIRILLYYLQSQKGLILINPYIYCIVDILIIISTLTFVYEDKKIRKIIYIIVSILVLFNIGLMCDKMENAKSVFFNSKEIKVPVVIQIENEENSSEIYVYEIKYGIFSEVRDIIYSNEKIPLNTEMDIKWINDNLLSITYKSNNTITEKIAYFGPSEKKYINLINNIKGTWQALNGDKLTVSNEDIEYVQNGKRYMYPLDSSDEQNNFSTVIYGNYSKPSITIIKENDENILVGEVKFGEEKEILMSKK